MRRPTHYDNLKGYDPSRNHLITLRESVRLCQCTSPDFRLLALGEHRPHQPTLFECQIHLAEGTRKGEEPFCGISWIILAVFGLEALSRHYLSAVSTRTGGLISHIKTWLKGASEFDKKWVKLSFGLVIISVIVTLVFLASRADLERYFQNAGFPKTPPSKMVIATSSQIADFFYGELLCYIPWLALCFGILICIMNPIPLFRPEYGFEPKLYFQTVPKPGVTVICAPEDFTFEQTKDVGPVAIYELKSALPRAKLYAHWTQATTNEQAVLQQLASPQFDPHQSVFVASDTPLTEKPAALGTDPGTVNITYYKPKHIQLHECSVGLFIQRLTKIAFNTAQAHNHIGPRMHGFWGLAGVLIGECVNCDIWKLRFNLFSDVIDKLNHGHCVVSQLCLFLEMAIIVCNPFTSGTLPI